MAVSQLPFAIGEIYRELWNPRKFDPASLPSMILEPINKDSQVNPIKFMLIGLIFLAGLKSEAQMAESYTLSSQFDSKTQLVTVTFGNLRTTSQGENVLTTLVRLSPDLIETNSQFNLSQFKLKKDGFAIVATAPFHTLNGDLAVTFSARDMSSLTAEVSSLKKSTRRITLVGSSALALFTILKTEVSAPKHTFYNNSYSLLLIPALGFQEPVSNIECFHGGTSCTISD